MAKTTVKDAAKRIDKYISSAEPFAQVICKKLRTIILNSEPEIIEDWKWGPNYSRNGMVCGFGAFKKHVTLFFFKGALLKDKAKILTGGSSNLNTRSAKFVSADDISEKVISAYIREAVKINEAGLKPEKKELEIPSELKKILNKDKTAEQIFEKLAYTHKKEYIMWIREAKKEETRERRLGKVAELLKAGKKGI